MNEKKKVIWHLSSNRWNSAITEYALSACRSLALLADEYEVVFTPLKDSPAEQRAQKLGLNVQAVPSFKPSSLLAFLKMKKTIKPDVIIVYGGTEAFLAKFIGLGQKVFRFFGDAHKDLSSQRGWQQRLSYSHINGIILPSKSLATQFDKLGVGPTKAIYLGIDAKTYRRSETMGGFLKKRPTVLVFGRLDPVKGHDEAIVVMKEVIKNWEDRQRLPCLMIVGKEENLKETDLKEMVNAAGLQYGEDVFVSLGHVEQVSALLSSAILGLIPSKNSELICRVAEEFLFCGTPIVVSDVGSLPEMITENVGAVLTSAMSLEEKAKLITEWLKKSMSEGETAKRRRTNQAYERFSFSGMAAQLKEFIN